MLKMLKKAAAILLSVSLSFFIASCEKRKADVDDHVIAYDQIVARIDKLAESLGTEASVLPIADAFQRADEGRKAEIAIRLADDMALAQTLDIVNDEMLAIAGRAVLAYPHPLLLNNYASMLLGNGQAEDALFFFEEAANQAPGNMVFLTNIANTYIELGDFATASKYAEQALLFADDFGPAYQVLTTVHLKEGNSELAAETMVKSAKHGFNEVTVHQFESFLAAVSALDPAADEYPLKEEILDALYEIARANVDTLGVRPNVDTPEGQIAVRPFPSIGSGEQLMKMETYLRSEAQKLQGRWDEAHADSIEYGQGFSDNMSPDSPDEEGIYPIQKNMRQIYAYMVMESFYDFKLAKAGAHYDKQLEAYHVALDEQLTKLDETYEKKLEEMEKESEDELRKVFEGIFSLQSASADKLLATQVAAAQTDVDWKTERLNLYKQYAEKIIVASQEVYIDSEQKVEEFWLKSGGLVKYVAEEDVFHYLNARREMLVFGSIGDSISRLADTAMELSGQKRELIWAEQLLDVAMRNAGVVAEAAEQADSDGSEEGGKNLVPDIEKQALKNYPEKYATADITFGLEGDLFGLVGGSLSSNGDAYELSLDSFAGSVTGTGSFFSAPDEKKAYTLHYAKVAVNTEWYKKSNKVKSMLEKTGKAGKWIGAISYADSERSGEYITSKAGKGFIDRGTVYVKETGGGIGDFSRTEKTEVFKSYATGVSTVSKSVKYQFLFVSVQVSE